VATIQGITACAVVVLTRPEQVQVCPWSPEVAVKTFESSDQAAHSRPEGSTEMLGKM